MQHISDRLKKTFSASDDFVEHKVTLVDGSEISIYFVESLINDAVLGNNVIKQLTDIPRLPEEKQLEFMQSKIAIGGSELSVSMHDIKIKLLSGNAIVSVLTEEQVLLIPIQGWEKRAVMEPPTSAVLKGPREGFTEDIKVNLGLIRRHLKTSDLIVKDFRFGKYTATKVCLLYIKTIADHKVVREVEKRIKKINIDGVIDSFYIQSLIEPRKSGLFKQIGNTEKPDVAISKILEGRVLIIVDGSPIVLTLPFLLLEDFQSSDDYYMHPLRSTFIRVIRLLGLIMSIMLPGLYVALESFHYRLLPIDFLITLINSIQGISFPPLIEILFVLFLFEILNEASIRMPKYLGMALSIIGALILGDTAVQAGIISSPSVMIVAMSGITLYIVPDQAATCSLLRLVFTVLGGVAGFFGIILGFLFLTTYLLDLDSYGTPYLAPYAPTVASDKKDAIAKAKLVNMTTRPKSIPNINKVRMKNE